MIRTLITLIILLLFNYAHGYTDCVDDGQGGLSCFDYDSGSFTDITPREPEPDGSRTYKVYQDGPTGWLHLGLLEPLIVERVCLL